MKIRKLLAAALVLVMVLAAVPVLSLAEGARTVTYEARQMSKLDRVWAALDAAEASALSSNRSTKAGVIGAVYQAALNLENVDKDSFSDFSKDGFFFTVDGMQCGYNYRVRNELKPGAAPVPESEQFVFVKGSGEQGKAPNSPHVLLVAPYYGQDASFTNQYKNEAQSIANTTGGNYTLIQSAAATGPAIAQNITNKGVVIYDSHGVQSGTSSYLCLTTNSGITVNDYNNGWAVASGNAAFIDGRYVQNHINGNLGNAFIWMAICEGMKRAGRGTTGTALLNAGAGGVYGYSQSVSFRGDYNYEATFWNQMKNGATVAEAIRVMKNTHGNSDPYTNPTAWPIVMSPTDAFPANPDGPQDVTCNWRLIGGGGGDAGGDTTYRLVNSIENGGKYIIVAASSVSGSTGYAVGNTAVSNNRYLTPVRVNVGANSVTVNDGDLSAVTWTASGSSANGFSFKNDGNGRYMGLDSAQYLCPSSNPVAWKHTAAGALDNQVDTDGYYYLSYSSGRYTTSKNSGAVMIFEVQAGSGNPVSPQPPVPSVTYELASYIVPGYKYIIVSSGSVSGTRGYAVGNTIVSGGHYLQPVAVTVNSDNTLTMPAGTNVDAITWTAGGSSYYGYTFRNVGNGKYMGLDSAQYLAPTASSLAWSYVGGALDNRIDTDGYYYLSYSTGRYTTSKNAENILLYRVVEG